MFPMYENSVTPLDLKPANHGGKFGILFKVIPKERALQRIYLRFRLCACITERELTYNNDIDSVFHTKYGLFIGED